MQYFQILENAGIEVTSVPFFDDSYVAGLYGDGIPFASVAVSYFKRIKALIGVGRYDVIWAEAEIFPYLPAFAERLLSAFNIPLVLDYDDAIFHRYDLHDRAVIRTLFGRKVDSAMAASKLVAAGNDYLLRRAVAAGAPRVEYLPTVIDESRYAVAVNRPVSSKIKVGWIGSPSTAHYLNHLVKPLAALSARYDIDCIAIGARADQVEGTPFRAVEWTEDTEVALLQSFDIGVMPLTDSPWERGKCGYKLIQYMAVGLPVVASPVGVNCQIVQDGGNGYLAEDDADWEKALEALISDAGKRQLMGVEGRKRVEVEYSVQAQAPRLVEMINSVVRRPE